MHFLLQESRLDKSFQIHLKSDCSFQESGYFSIFLNELSGLVCSESFIFCYNFIVLINRKLECLVKKEDTAFEWRTCHNHSPCFNYMDRHPSFNDWVLFLQLGHSGNWSTSKELTGGWLMVCLGATGYVVFNSYHTTPHLKMKYIIMCDCKHFRVVNTDWLQELDKDRERGFWNSHRLRKAISPCWKTGGKSQQLLNR